MSNVSRPKIALIDGHSLVHRAYHAIPPLFTTSGGEPTNAVFGFTSMLLKVLSDVQPTYLAVAFDRTAPTFRHRQYAEYKATRPRTADELRLQFARVHEVVEAFGMPVFELDGFEADDVLGCLAKQAEGHGLVAVIVTGDLDALQLISDHCVVHCSRGRIADAVIYDVAAVRERYQVDPGQLPDLKALAGDPSDNIKGVPGIGVKKAAKLLSEHRTIEDVYASLDRVPPKLRPLLAAHEQRVRQNKDLATIRTDVPCVLDLRRSKLDTFDRPRVLELFRELEFKSLVSRLPTVEHAHLQSVAEPAAAAAPAQLSLFQAPMLSKTGPESASIRRGSTATVAAAGTGPSPLVDRTTLPSLVRQLSTVDTVVLHPVFVTRSAIDCDLAGLAYASAGSEGYIPVSAQEHGVAEATLLESLQPLLRDEKLTKVGHDLKRLYSFLDSRGRSLSEPVFDTAVAAYVLNPAGRAVTVKNLVFGQMGREIADIESLAPKGTSLTSVPPAQVAEHAATEAALLLEAAELLRHELTARGQIDLLEWVELPLIPVLSRLERAGVAIDVEFLAEMGDELGQQIARVQREAQAAVGHEFNIASPQQLGRLLVEELRLPLTRRTKTGWSTDQSVLEELLGTHPVIEHILEYRQLTKLKSTYVDTLPALINPRTGRVHTNFNQMATATGRLSSSDPNLQNIPIRTELGRKIRRAFVTGSPNTVLLAADYAQIELRILAHLSQDRLLMQAFREGKDIHTATAARLFHTAAERVTPEQRRLAKTANFAILYGVSDWGLAQRTGMTRREAAPFIATYLGQYTGVREYMDRTLRIARETGHVETLLHRRRYLPELRSAHGGLRAAAERMAINHPVQGTQADLIKLAMIAIDDELRRRDCRAQMILQVHDELVFELPQDDIENIGLLIRERMEQALHLDVPVVVQLKVGSNWSEMDPYA